MAYLKDYPTIIFLYKIDVVELADSFRNLEPTHLSDKSALTLDILARGEESLTELSYALEVLERKWMHPNKSNW